MSTEKTGPAGPKSPSGVQGHILKFLLHILRFKTRYFMHCVTFSIIIYLVCFATVTDCYSRTPLAGRLGFLPSVGWQMSTSQRAVMLCGWEGNHRPGGKQWQPTAGWMT